jgi:hypothetical protein
MPQGRQPIQPDQQALQDDLVHAVDLIDSAGPSRYVADFVRGLARSCHDTRLEGAAVQAAASPDGLVGLSRLLQLRIKHGADPFALAPIKNA